MAVSHTTNRLSRSATVISWNGLNNSDGDGSSALMAEARGDGTISVQVDGTFDTATVVLEGRNDPDAAWQTLKDADGNAISLTTAGLVAVRTPSAYVRPSASSTGASTDLNVHLFSVDR